MEHTCNQGQKFDEMQQNHTETQMMVVNLESSVQNVKNDLEKHRKHEKEMSDKLDKIANQMTSLIELNTDVSNIKIAWRVGKSFGASVVKFTLAATVILGAIYAIKEWIKK